MLVKLDELDQSLGFRTLDTSGAAGCGADELYASIH
jgi:hypothetical protein